MKKPVQLYKYDEHSLQFTEDEAPFFGNAFDPKKELGSTYWLNFHSMVDVISIRKICERLQVDKLIQEDLFKGTKRPRLEEFPTYVFFSIESALPTDASNFNLKKERISFLMGQNYLISFQEKSSDHFPTVRERIEHDRGIIRKKGPDFLLYRLLETIIDNYDEVIDEIAEQIVILDKLVILKAKSDVLQKIEWQKRKLLELRKTVQPMRELIGQLERVEHTFFVHGNKHYFKEIKDSCIAVIEEIDAQKQILEGVSNLYYAVQGQKMNEIMKVLTVTSAVFIPLTFIVGVYGMNFDNMPELHWKYGYFWVMGLMAVLAVTLVFVFYKRGWLRRN